MSSNDTTTTDDTLRKRLRDKLGFQSTDADETTEQEATTDTGDDAGSTTEQEGDYEDGEDGDEDDDMEAEAGDETAQEMGAEDAVDLLVDTTEMDRDQAMMFANMLGSAGKAEDGGATGDAEEELSAEADVDAAEVADAAAEAAAETIDQELADRLDDVVTEDDLSDRLESFADTVGEEMQTTVEQALTGETPTPTSSGDSDVSKDDLFGGNSGGDDA